MTTIDYNKIYNQYAKDVISGKIIAGEYIKLACERYLSWFNRDDIYFDYEDVDKKIKFVSLMKHSTGSHAGSNFILLPWQQFLFAGIFGFKWCDTKYRVVTKVLAFIARKNGKTATAAALALAHVMVDKEAAAEAEIVANSRQQANIGLVQCINFAESIDPKKKYLKPYRSQIKIPKTKSIIQVLSSDSMGNDGYNSS